MYSEEEYANAVGLGILIGFIMVIASVIYNLLMKCAFHA